MRTAILGATGYIGESLGRTWGAAPGELVLFARRPEALRASPGTCVRQIDAFDAAHFDLVINAIGTGDPAKAAALGEAILDITRQWDDRVLEGLRPDGRYVFLSSGAVHAQNPQPAYTQSKREAEAAHRALADRAILDLRVFGYAESNIKLNAAFFLADLARSVAEHRPFRTNRADMVRDYAGSQELKDMISAWLAAGNPNLALDLYSVAPVSKMELLDLAQTEFALGIEWVDAVQAPPTGHKPAYASTDHAAAQIGYQPRRTALEAVRAVLKAVRAEG